MMILTFNIRNGLAADGEHSWERRKRLTSQTIRDTNADIIGLQEVYVFQLVYLLEQLSEYQSYSVGREDGVSAGEQCSILWRRDSFGRAKAGTFWLSDTLDVPNSTSWGNRITRICSWVEFVEGFRFYNTHWDHESQPARQQSAELIRQVLPGRPWILVGDFNAEPGSSEMDIMAGAGHFVTEENPIGTFHDFRGGTDGDRIDHIFVSSGLSCGAPTILVDSDGGLYPSDHYPVLCEVSL